MTTAQIHLATLETTTFYFEGFGTTEEGAVDALTAALHKHGRQYRLPRDWHVEYGDPSKRAVRFGHGYRDGDRITGGKRPQARK